MYVPVVILCEIVKADIYNEDQRLVSAVDYYFIQEDGGRFKVCLCDAVKLFQWYVYFGSILTGHSSVQTILLRGNGCQLRERSCFISQQKIFGKDCFY